MRLVSVNVGKARPIAAKSGRTGIYKRPHTEPVRVTKSGLQHDAICDTDNHGGPDQAVYIYGLPDYVWWSETLGKPLEPGTFGENLTMEGFESTEFNVGDRFFVGDTVLEVTAPRVPCVTLAVRMDDPAFVKRFRHAERPGVYCRVLQEGFVQVGDEVRLEPYKGDTWGEALGVLELFRHFYRPKLDEATLRRHLAAPIAVRDRVEKEAALAKMQAY